MAVKTPRNQTIEVLPAEGKRLLEDCMTLEKRTNSRKRLNKVIHQNMLDAIKNLPDSFVNPLLVDPRGSS